ncbi:hypothetical protein DSUL_60098 [Desulfovibrionales bacterium]
MSIWLSKTIISRLSFKHNSSKDMEFFSIDNSYSMASLRTSFCYDNQSIVNALQCIKNYLGCSIFQTNQVTIIMTLNVS